MPFSPIIVNATLRCPACGEEWVHVNSVIAKVRDREDGPARLVSLDGSGNVHDDGSTRDPMEGHALRDNDRRQSFALVGECEMCGCEFAICFKQHKGQTEVGASVRTWRPG